MRAAFGAYRTASKELEALELDTTRAQFVRGMRTSTSLRRALSGEDVHFYDSTPDHGAPTLS